MRRSFLVVSTTALGDTLFGTPALAQLRQLHPNAKITVLTSRVGGSVLAHNPSVDDLFTTDRSLWFLYHVLRKLNITDVLLFHASQRYILPFVSLLGAERVVGTLGLNKGLDQLLTHPLDNAHLHEVYRRLEMVGGQQLALRSLLFLTQEEEEAVEVMENRVCLHPGAADLFKRWPAQHFISLGKQLMQETGCQIVVTGTPAETSLVDEIVRGLEGSIAVTHLPLRSFAALLKGCALLVTNDTGAMHLGASVGTPTVALFCPTDPLRCAPLDAPHVKVIAKPKPCTPCLKKKCRDPFCFLQIGVAEVYDAAFSLLGPHGLLP